MFSATEGENDIFANVDEDGFFESVWFLGHAPWVFESPTKSGGRRAVPENIS